MEALQVGSKVSHPVYGKGVVLSAWSTSNNGKNYAIKFEKGGPLGWATRSTNDPETLTVIN